MFNFIKYLKEKKIRNVFIKKFRDSNKHNSVFPVNLFPIDIVNIGKHSYGELNLISYQKDNKEHHLEIGSFVSISTGVKFFLHENHKINTLTTFPLSSIFNNTTDPRDACGRGSIVIEDEVWLGNGVMVMSGVRIGKGAIVAAGSVVTKDVDAYCIVGGVPAKLIRMRFTPEIRDRLKKIYLKDIDDNLIKKNIDIFYEEIDESKISYFEKLTDKGCE